MADGQLPDASDQVNLLGEQVTTNRTICSYQDAFCDTPATHALTNVGGNAFLDSLDEIVICEDCLSEARYDFVDPQPRELKPSERWYDVE